jgi:hypothetical protein
MTCGIVTLILKNVLGIALIAKDKYRSTIKNLANMKHNTTFAESSPEKHQ